MANEFIARKGLIVLANGVQVTGSSQFSADITASGNITATAFYGDGANVTGVVSSSYATTSSLATKNLLTASAAGSTITFTKGDGSTFPVTITTATAESASYVEYSNVANKPTLVSASSQIDHDATTNFVANEHIDHSTVNISAGSGLSGGGDITATRTLTLDTSSAHFTGGVKTKLNADGVVSSSAQVSYTGLSNVPAGIVSSSTQFSTLADPFTGSFTGSFTGDGSGLTGVAATLSTAGTSGTGTVDLKTQTLTVNGANGVTTTASGQTITVSIPSGTVSSSAQVTYSDITGVPAGIVSSSGQVDHDQTTNFVANEHIDHSAVSITAGSGLSGGGDITSTRTLTLDTSSAHFTGGVKTKLNADGVFSSSAQVQYSGITGVPSGIVSSSGQVSYTGLSNVPAGIVSSSGQVDVRNTTGIATIATTGSNTFTGVQTINDTTNSTVYSDGALVVAGGVGIAKDVNISGSLTVLGLLTAVSSSIQYVTSSQLIVADNKIAVNTSDLTRFGGLSVYDSGSSATTASIFWDSQNHKFIYENLAGLDYGSAMFIGGPKNTGTLGDEVGLTAGRIPVATGDDHIDTNPASSSLYIDFADGKVYVENGLYVTGSVSSSVGFWGDGSNLTGVVSTLAVTGSDGASVTTGTVNLKTQAITYSAGEGVDISVSGQTVSIAGEDATSANKGIASFDATNFTVSSGNVTSNNITINGTGVTLGGTRNITLAQITTQGATTTDQVTLAGGAIVHGILHTSGSTTVVAPAASVVATISTGSYDAAHFDYVLKSSTNLRTGTVMTIWEAGTTNIEFTDTSTNDIGDTLSETFSADLLNGNVRLKLTGDGSTWTVKTAIRMI